MPDEIAPSAPAGSGIRGRLGRRIGPLPVWGWGVVIVGGVAVFVLARRRGGGSTSGSGRTIAAETGDEGALSRSGSGGGSGGGGGTSRPSTPLTVPDPRPIASWLAPAPVGPGGQDRRPTATVAPIPLGFAAGPAAPGAGVTTYESTDPTAPGGFYDPVTDPYQDTGWYQTPEEQQQQMQEDDPGQSGYGFGEDIADLNDSAPPRTEDDGRTYDVPEAVYGPDGSVVGWG